MGVVARELEASGLATTSITMVREHTARVKQPRALFVPYPFGHPLGDADDRPGQLRVIRAALALLERSAGPVLEDFADERYAAREELNLPQAASVPSTPKEVDPADEVSALRPWHEAWLREHDGRTGIGLSGVDPRRFRGVIRFLQDYAAGKDGEPPESSAGVPVPRFIRLVADDLKAFYYESRMAQTGERDFQAIARWFWGETALADLLRRIRDRMKATGDPALDAVAFGIAR